MEMTRRGFMKVAGAFVALAGLQKIVPNITSPEPKHWADVFAETGVLENVTLYLDSTLHLSKVYGDGAIIRNCEFIANYGFKGKSLIDVSGAQGWTITSCSFSAPYQNIHSAISTG